MQQITRRGFARRAAAGAGSAAMFNIVRALGDTPQFQYKIGSDLPLSHPDTLRLQQGGPDPRAIRRPPFDRDLRQH